MSDRGDDDRSSDFGVWWAPGPDDPAIPSPLTLEQYTEMLARAAYDTVMRMKPGDRFKIERTDGVNKPDFEITMPTHMFPPKL